MYVAIHAAGGLLWQNSGRALSLALVHRARYDDWGLPKGKLKRGESWLQAATREVEEETGYKPDVLGFAGALAYDTERGPKIVRFWNMTPRTFQQNAVNPSEIVTVEWLSPAEAIRRLTYPLERLMVETWHTQINLPMGGGP